MPEEEKTEESAEESVDDRDYGEVITEQLRGIMEKLDSVLDHVSVPHIAEEARDVTEPATEAVSDIADEGTEIVIPPAIPEKKKRFHLGKRPRG